MSILDFEQINGLIEAAGVAGAKEIMDAFWRSTEALCESLDEELAAANYSEASKIAHALKGLSLKCGRSGDFQRGSGD